MFCPQETVHLPGQVLAARQVLVPVLPDDAADLDGAYGENDEGDNW